MKVSQIVSSTEAEGPGKRLAIWLQGCPFRCKGCCNPEYLSFSGGKEMSIDSISFPPENEGITILGGEPFAQPDALLELSEKAKLNNQSVMIFSGYLYEELKEKYNNILSRIDILVDGKYEKDLPDNNRRWIGSTNQRIFFLSDRYSLKDFEKKNTLEIRLINNEIVINGFPHKKAIDIWKKIQKVY